MGSAFVILLHRGFLKREQTTRTKHGTGSVHLILALTCYRLFQSITPRFQAQQLVPVCVGCIGYPFKKIKRGLSDVGNLARYVDDEQMPSI